MQAQPPRPAIALYQPDIAQNVGTILRLGACLDLPVHVIEPCGFPFSARALRRSAMDYMETVDLTGHEDYAAFSQWQQSSGRRLILLSTKADTKYVNFNFHSDDILLLGQESAGVPQFIHDAVDARLRIPMVSHARSLNIAVSLAMVAGEMLRQSNGFPNR